MKVYLEFRGQKHHTLYDELINYPPDGVEYQISSGDIYSAQPYKIFHFMYHHLFKKLKPDIGNIYYDLSKQSKNVDLVHVCNNFTPQKTNWVMDLENIGSFTGYDFQAVPNIYKNIEKALCSDQCKKIMPWTNAGKKNLEHTLETKKFEDKLEVVHPAIHVPQNVTKNKNYEIKILFIGSINYEDSFFFKGGKEVLICFDVLSKKYDIELIVRSKVPKDIKIKYQNRKGLTFLDQFLPRNELFDIYNNSDISLLPCHNYPLMAMLESMSFGLPIVTINGWSTAEFVEHEKSGFMVKPSKYITILEETPFEDLGANSKLLEGLQKNDPRVINDLVEYTSILIEDDSLRDNMGKYARKKVSDGDLSIKMRNEKLKRIYEESSKK